MPGVPIPLSIASDMTLPFLPPPITTHDFVPIPPAPAPPVCMAIESPVAILWGPGFALFQNKITRTVIHQGLPFAVDGHDCGYMIPHVTVPINNARLPMIIAFSGRKMAFAASTVKADGAAVGCSTLLLFPMMCCAFPVTLPTGFPPGNTLNTVTVGLTPGDIIAGIINIAATIAADILTYGAPSAPTLSEVAAKTFLGDTPRNWAIKQGLGALAGLARILITGDGSIQVQAGSSYAGVTLSFSRTADGTYTLGIGGQLGVPVGVGVVGGQAGAQVAWAPDGTRTTTTSYGGAAGTAAGPLASGGTSTATTTTTTTAPDGTQTTQTTTADQSVGVAPLHGVQSNTTSTSAAGSPPTTTGYQSGHAQGKPWGKPL